MVSPSDLMAPAPDPLAPDTKLQGPLDLAVATVAKARGQTSAQVELRFAIVDITDPGGSWPFAGFRADVTDYIASEGKVAVMFAAYAMREAAGKSLLPLYAFPAQTPDGAMSETLIRGLSSRLLTEPDPKPTPTNPHPKPLDDSHRLPRYAGMLTGSPPTVDFTATYVTNLEKMIVESDDELTAECVHGIGYSFLNGVLDRAGFFDAGGENGLWIAGDYREEKFSSREKYPAVRIAAMNDVDTAQGGTAREMAWLVALMATGRLISAGVSGEMMGLLTKAATVVPPATHPFDPPFISRGTSIPEKCVVANKLGVGPYKNGRNCFSEVNVLARVGKPERRYVVAWQNLDRGLPYQFTDVATIVRKTILDYELLIP